MNEAYRRPLLPKRKFYRRVLRNAKFSLYVILVSLAIGIAGYHWICCLSWIDSLLNASMILTGMGPVNPMTNVASKLFASFYSIFSGVAFLTTIAVLLAPVLHRIIHRFHLEEDNG